MEVKPLYFHHPPMKCFNLGLVTGVYSLHPQREHHDASVLHFCGTLKQIYEREISIIFSIF